jgi:hypothetical protein
MFLHLVLVCFVEDSFFSLFVDALRLSREAVLRRAITRADGNQSRRKSFCVRASRPSVGLSPSHSNSNLGSQGLPLVRWDIFGVWVRASSVFASHEARGQSRSAGSWIFSRLLSYSVPKRPTKRPQSVKIRCARSTRDVRIFVEPPPPFR